MDLLLVEQTLSKLLAHLSGIVHKSTIIGFLYVVKVKYQPRTRLLYVSAICFFQISNNYNSTCTVRVGKGSVLYDLRVIVFMEYRER